MFRLEFLQFSFGCFCARRDDSWRALGLVRALIGLSLDLMHAGFAIGGQHFGCDIKLGRGECRQCFVGGCALEELELDACPLRQSYMARSRCASLSFMYVGNGIWGWG